MRLQDILTEDSWCKHARARDKNGSPRWGCGDAYYDGYSPSAVQFCLIGALEKKYGKHYFFLKKEMQNLARIISNVGGLYCPNEPDRVITDYNDRRAESFDEIKLVIEKYDEVFI